MGQIISNLLLLKVQVAHGSSSKGTETLSAKNGIQNIGIAVFKDDRLVGSLNKEETLAHLLLTNELKSCNISIPDPENNSNEIDLYLTSNHISKINVSIVNGLPYIKAKIYIDAKISSIDNISQEMTEERLKQIEASANNYLESILSSYLYKTSKEFHSDIAGFGKYVLKHFSTVQEFNEYDWLNKYQDAFFDVHANVSIKSGFLLTGT